MPPPVRKRRAIITVRRDVTEKRFIDPALARAEITWFQQLPWACPQLVDADLDSGRMVIRTHPVALDRPDWRPAAELAALLYAIHSEGVHHRDVHVGNLVVGPDGPLLIDWETAMHRPGAPSYDLHGPDVSGVPVPAIHAGITPQWWGSAQQMSIRSRWETDVPANLA